MFLMVIVSFLRFAMQKKIKRLDFKLLQNRNPTVVYGVVYVLWYCFARNLSKIKTKISQNLIFERF